MHLCASPNAAPVAVLHAERVSARIPRSLLSHDKLLLAASNALVDKELKIDPAVFASSVRSLVRCCRIRLTHRAWRSNVLCRHVTILEQIGDHSLSTLLAELLVVFKFASRVGIPSDFDHKSRVGERLVCQGCDFLLGLLRKNGITDFEAHGCFTLHVPGSQIGKALLGCLRNLLDALLVGCD